MDMKLLAFCMVSLYVGYASGEYCYDNVVTSCSPVGGEITACNAKYGAFKGEDILKSVQNYVKTHILHSYQYLLMSSHFGNYEKNRAGFEKLYRKLSDNTWEQAIELAKYLGKRGGHMSFLEKGKEKDSKAMEYEMHELGSMSKALDLQKSLAEDATTIHGDVTRRKEHDAEVASYLENNFVHQHADMIRTLAGHTSDLKHLIANQADPSLSLYLFDEYLQKTV